MTLTRQPEAEVYIGGFVQATLRAGGVDLVPFDPRPARVFLAEDEAVQLALAILRRYDVTLYDVTLTNQSDRAA